MNPEKQSSEGRKITWAQLKQLVEDAGVKDGDEIDDIDISWGNLDEIECYKDEVFGWIIRL